MSDVIDTTGAIRVMESSWDDSVFSERALTDLVDQGESCVCYGLTVAEASRAVINLKQDSDIKPLSSMEIVCNSFGKQCRGHHASSALEWATRESLAEESAMKLDIDKITTFRHKRAEVGRRYAIDDWEPISNCEEDMISRVIRQPIIISLSVSHSLITNYQGGLIDPYLMERKKDLFPHSMLLTGFGFYVFNDRSKINFWQVKNSMGLECGVNGFIYFIRNSSLPTNKWVIYNPMIPLSFAKDETYEVHHLVKDMSFEELAKFEMNPNLDIIIMFYTGARDHRPFFRDFERASRIYITDKEDVVFALVNATGSELNCCKKYGFTNTSFPKLRVYKFVGGSRKPSRSRRLVEQGRLWEKGNINFEIMSKFLVGAAGGVLGGVVR